jgi:cell volume regulation protein A
VENLKFISTQIFHGYLKVKYGLDITILAFLVAGVVIILGYLGEEFFKRTSIPDPILLLLLGVLLGPILNIFSHNQLISITPYFSALALIVILFDGGLNMNIKEAIRNSPRTLLLGSMGWLLSVVATALLCKYIFDWRWLNGLLLGCIIGGSSSIIVIALSRKIGVDEKTETVLSLESILTDVLCTVGAFAVIGIILSGEVSIQTALFSVVIAFAVGIVVGSLIGLAWLTVLQKLKDRPNTYMLTLGILLLTYVAAKNLGGTGAISALFLGLILGNAPQMAKVFKFTNSVSIDDCVRGFHSQISFLIRSFFFVFTGLLFSYSSTNILLFGLLLSFVFLGIRFFTVRVSFLKSNLKETENLVSIMLPRGLAAAVLASIPFTSGVPGSEVFPEIVFIVIITTIIICTVGVSVLKKKTKQDESIIVLREKKNTTEN